MTFTSAVFLLFIVICVGVYYLCPKRFRWITLLVFSYVFYLWGGIGVLGYILFTTVTTYLTGVCIGSIKPLDDTKESRKRAKRRKKNLAALVLVLNFGLLYFVKYWNFTLDILHVNARVLRFNILLPLGISFYIFQSMGYIVDLVRDKYPPQKNFFKFALFVSFFPQLTQGPISRYDSLSCQLYNGNTFSFCNLKEGIKLMVWGYIKKLVIADRAAVAVCAIIDNYTAYRGSVILFGVVLYCMQLYCDFSGGIDIARGAARLFGIDMAQNFKRPLFATSLTDFWRRWHITLGAWLKDYLFYPITLSKPFISLGKFIRRHIKSKAGKILPTSIATFIIYFVIGIWHGASWKYIAFGFWNGSLITLALLFEPFFARTKDKLSINDSSLWYRILCIVRTCIIIVLGRYITRASGVSEAMDMLWRTVQDFGITSLLDGTLLTFGLTLYDYMVILFGVIVVFVFELCEEIGFILTKKIEEKGSLGVFILSFFAVVILLYFGIFRGNYISSEFIYKQF